MDNLLIGDFEGPLDLLLHLIKESKVDIWDISIEDVTKQYLDYIHKMEELNIDVASEYNDLISLMLKGIIISIITSISSDICNESGSVSVGKAIQFAGRVMIMLLSYPLIENIIRTAVSFVGE